MGFAHTREEYRKIMSEVEYAFNKTSEKGKYRDLAWNMVAWSSFTIKSKEENHGGFEFYPTGTLY